MPDVPSEPDDIRKAGTRAAAARAADLESLLDDLSRAGAGGTIDAADGVARLSAAADALRTVARLLAEPAGAANDEPNKEPDVRR